MENQKSFHRRSDKNKRKSNIFGPTLERLLVVISHLQSSFAIIHRGFCICSSSSSIFLDAACMTGFASGSPRAMTIKQTVQNA
jgi:hypothetical protein